MFFSFIIFYIIFAQILKKQIHTHYLICSFDINIHEYNIPRWSKYKTHYEITVKNGPLSKLPGYPLKVMHYHTDKIEIKFFNEDSFLFLGTLIKIWKSNDKDPIITKKNYPGKYLPKISF